MLLKVLLLWAVLTLLKMAASWNTFQGASGSLGVKGSRNPEEEAGAVDVLVPRRMLGASIVLLLRTVPLLWPTAALRKALVLQRALASWTVLVLWTAAVPWKGACALEGVGDLEGLVLWG